MTYLNPLLNQMPPVPNPLYGGSLGTGPTGLAGLLGTGVPTQSLPFANPLGSLMQGGPTGLGGAQGIAGQGALPYSSPGLGGQLAARAGGLVANPEAAGLGRFLAPGVTGRAALGRAGLGGVAGMIGSNLIDATDIGGQNSNLEQGLQGAAQGAGLGAGIGSVVPGLGTGVGALVGGVTGGAIGILGNLFGGGDSPDPREAGEDILATAISQAQIPDDMAREIIDTYDVLLTFAEAEEGDEAKALAADAALDQAGQMVLAAMQQREQATSAASNTLALQQQSQEIFAPLADDIRQSGAAYAQAMGANRQYLPESYRAFADADVARELHSSNKLADAYMAQAAVTPAVNQLTQYQQDFQGYAAQLFAQQMAQQAAGQTTGGAQDISALLQPGV